MKKENGILKEEVLITKEPNDALVSIPFKEFDLEEEIEKIEKGIDVFKKIRSYALKLTQESDWLDQQGRPYLSENGAQNLAIPFGIDYHFIRNKEGQVAEMKWLDDEKGRYYMFIIESEVHSKRLNRKINAIGSATSRDQFFAKVGVELKPIENVDITNIIAKAETRSVARGIRKLLGMTNVAWEDLKSAGLNREKIPKIEYKTGAQKTAVELSSEGKEIRNKLGNMLLQMGNNDKKMAAILLEKYSCWKDDKGKEHKALSLEAMSEKWINSTYGKAKKDYEKTTGGPTDEKEPEMEG